MINGLRFDLQFCLLSTCVAIAGSLTTCWWLDPVWRHRLRTTIWSLVTTASLFAAYATVQYFREFGCQFDMRIMEPLNEDLFALAKTVWQTYPVVWASIAMLASLAICAWSGRAFLSRESTWIARFHRVPIVTGSLVTLALVLALVTLGRGSLWGRPLQFGTAAITSDVTLNRLIPTPWHAINYAISRWNDLRNGNNTAILSPDQLLPAARLIFAGQACAYLDRCTLRTAAGPRGPVPTHIVILLLEGQSGFPLFATHRGLGLNPHLADIADRGLYLERFLPASRGTIYSLGALFTGIPDSGVTMSLAPLARRPFPSSLAPLF